MFDTERQIRFLYPPLFFIGSLLIGIRLDPNITAVSVCRLIFDGAVPCPPKGTEWTTPIVALVTAGGLVATIAVGFLIGAVTILVLRLATRKRRAGSYEAADFSGIKAKDARLTAAGPTSGDGLFRSATLDHELIEPGVHMWIFRRWTMFYVYAHSVTALFLALGVGWLLHVRDGLWFTLSVCAALGLGYLAWASWKESMEMLTFQAQRPLSDKLPSDRNKPGKSGQ